MSDVPFYVYVYRDPRDGKNLQPIYVGKGTKNRSKVHMGSSHNPILRRINAKIRAAGLSPVCEIVGRFSKEGDAFFEERRLISDFGRLDLGTGSLANLTDGGEGTFGKSAEARERISAANRGRKPSAESLAKRSASLKGRIITLEQRAKISAANSGKQFRLGKNHSAETKAKMSAAAMGVKKSEQAKVNMAAARVGRKLSAEHKANIGAAGRGRVVSAETGAKITAAKLAYWASWRAQREVSSSVAAN